jgi:integrase/recombinase XerD
MLSELFESSGRIHALRAGPAGASLDAFAQALVHAGYAQITARRHLRAAEHFVAWADRHGLSVSRLTEDARVRFARHVARCRCRRYGRSDRSLLHGVGLFCTLLEETGTVRGVAVERTTSDPALLLAFRQWMHRQRGTCESTLDNYGIHIRALLKHVGEEPAT